MEYVAVYFLLSDREKKIATIYLFVVDSNLPSRVRLLTVRLSVSVLKNNLKTLERMTFIQHVIALIHRKSAHNSDQI